MLIEITRRGVYRGHGEMVPIGTQIEVPDDFTGWSNKYRVVAETKGKTLEVATPKHQDSEPDKTVEPPKTEVSEDLELLQARQEYERVTGEKPHGRKKIDTLREEIAAAREEQESE